MQVATTRTSCLTAASKVSMYGVVGQWTCSSARGECPSPRQECPGSGRDRGLGSDGLGSPAIRPAAPGIRPLPERGPPMVRPKIRLRAVMTLVVAIALGLWGEQMRRRRAYCLRKSLEHRTRLTMTGFHV